MSKCQWSESQRRVSLSTKCTDNWLTYVASNSEAFGRGQVLSNLARYIKIEYKVRVSYKLPGGPMWFRPSGLYICLL